MPEKRREYVHVIDGLEHVLLCTDEHAKLYGATLKTDVDATKADVASKMRAPRNKSVEPAETGE